MAYLWVMCKIRCGTQKYSKKKGGIKMAQDSKGPKFNRIPEYTKVVNGKKVTVPAHVRSNRKDSSGKK